jgi:tetratricopeptide (TPR) repeat protein
MKGSIVSCYLLVWIFQSQVLAQPCSSIRLPNLSEHTKEEMEHKLSKSYAEYKVDTTNADALIWYGRRLAYLGYYMEAIQVFTKGLYHDPKDARIYRHRGHRYITVRCFDLAIRDFEKAARLIKGTKDEVEPDGLPNSSNTPTSTLHSNIWYHLGLAYFLKGDFARASKAYQKGLKASHNPDMYVATANWQYLTLLNLHKAKKASTLLSTIDPSVKLLENSDYLRILMLYKMEKSTKDADGLLSENGNPLSNATRSFGVGHYILTRGDKTKAGEIFNNIIKGDQWASFGFLAAESELKRGF